MLEMLRSELRRIVEQYCTESDHRDSILDALARPGFALHPEAHYRASLFTLDIYSAICGACDIAATQAAVAVELYMQAAFMFDRVADEDAAEGKYLNAAQELSLGLTLLNCGATLACEVAHISGQSSSSQRSLKHFHSSCISASSGQFMDACLAKTPHVKMDEALRMTLLKSGSLGKFAAGFAARLATDNPEIVDLCDELGFNIFTYLQLVDDLRDACPRQGVQTDLMLHKKTVPLVFFQNSLSVGNLEVRAIISSAGGKNVDPDVRQAFEVSQAVTFGAIVAETFLNRAKDNLKNLEICLGVTLENIEHFLKSIELNPQDLSLV